MSYGAIAAIHGLRSYSDDSNIYTGKLALYKNLSYYCGIRWITKDGFRESAQFDGISVRERVHLIFESEDDVAPGVGIDYHVRLIEAGFAAPITILSSSPVIENETIKGYIVHCFGWLKSN